MKRAIKVLSIALALVAVLAVTMLGVMGVSVNAENIEVSATYEKVNEDIQMTFKVAGVDANTTIEGAEIKLSWANTATVKSIEKAGALSNAEFDYTADSNEATVTWVGSSIKADSEIFTVTFGNATGVLVVTPEVVSMGKTAAFVPYVYNSVKANAVYATSADATNLYTINEGDDPVASLNAAVASAGILGQDVTVVLNTDWVLTENVVIGTPGSIPANKITVTTVDGGSIYLHTGTAEDTSKGKTIGLYGNFVFERIGLYGATSYNWDEANVLFAPDGASITIENTVVTDGTKAVNVGGADITINGGNFHVVAGNTKTSGYKLSNDPSTADDDYANITITNATVDKAVGGSYNNNGTNGDAFERKTNIKVLGATNIDEAVLAGSWGAADTLNGGYLELNTTGTFGTDAHFIAVSYGPVSEAALNDANKYTVDYKSGTLTKQWEVCSLGKALAEGEQIYVNAEINLYAGPNQAGFLGGSVRGGKTALAFDIEGKIVANVKSGASVAGGLRCGSNMQYDAANAAAGNVSNIDVTLNFEKGSTMNGNIYGASLMYGKYSRDEGNSTINFGTGEGTGTVAFNNDFFGAGLVQGVGASTSGKTTVNMVNTVQAASKNFYGGANFNRNDAVSTRDFVLTAKDSTITNTFYGGARLAATSVTSATYNADVDMTLDNVTFRGDIAGGSNWTNAGTEEKPISHKGDVNLTIKNSALTTSIFLSGKLNKNYNHFEGDATLLLEGCTVTYSANSDIFGGYTVDKYAKLIGDTKIIIGNGTTISRSGTPRLRLAAGIMGYGTMVGDSTLEFRGNGKLNYFANSTVVTAGCIGSETASGYDHIPNGAGTTESPYGNTRQVGNVNFIMKDTSALGTATSVAGSRSNVDGDVNIRIEGGATQSTSPSFTTNLYGLSNSPSTTGHASITGDMNVYLSGKPYFRYTARFAGTHTATNNPGTGYNVIGGDLCVELDDYISNVYSGQKIHFAEYVPCGNTVVKIVGDSNVDFNTIGVWTDKSGAYAANYNQILDLTQYTGTTAVTSTVKSDYTKVYEVMNGQTVTIDGSATEVAKLDLTNSTFGWADMTATYAELTAYDANFVNKNAPRFENVTETTADLMIGDMVVGTYTLGGDIADVIADIRANYSIIGIGLRVNTPAMRCRARIDKDFFAEITANDASVKLVKLGIIVGTKNDAPYTYDLATGKTDAGTTDAWAWANGQLNPKMHDGNWGTEKGHEDSYIFRAVITGYGDSVDSLNEKNANTAVYFRAYMVIEQDGVQSVIYLDSPVEGEGQVNYGKSLVEAAEATKGTSWYTANQADVDKIIAAKKEA